MGPYAGGVPRRAAPAPSDASERASGKKPRRVAPARASSVCLAGVEEFCVPTQKRKEIPRNRNNVETAADMEVLTVGGEMSVSADPAQELLQKRLAIELDVLSGLLKKAELISLGACKGGAPTAGKKKEERFLASKQLSKPEEEDGGSAPSVKRRKISTLVQQKNILRAPRMSPEERNQIAGRLSSLSGELPGHIEEFLLKQFGNADTHGEIEINIDSVEDSILFELKTQLDKFAEESKAETTLEQEEEDVDICSMSPSPTPIETGSRPSSRSTSGSNTESYSASESEQIMVTSAQPPSEPASGTAAQSTAQAEGVSGESTGSPSPSTTVAVSEAAQGAEPNKVQEDVQRTAPKAVVNMPGLLYRARLRQQLMQMEKAVLPDESIYPRDLQRLCMAEYGRPSLMRHLGLFLRSDA